MVKSKTSSATYVAPSHPASRITKLRYYLDEHGISMAWVAKQVSINYDRFYRLCAGTGEPTLREGLRIKKLLGCQLQQIFEVDEGESEEGHD